MSKRMTESQIVSILKESNSGISQSVYKILSKIKDNTYVIALAIDGKMLSSEDLAEKLEDLAITGKSNIAFVIGGSLGLSDAVLKRADYKLSFSKMTFPHQLMRLIFFEQLYRWLGINNNIKYHK